MVTPTQQAPLACWKQFVLVSLSTLELGPLPLGHSILPPGTVPEKNTVFMWTFQRMTSVKSEEPWPAPSTNFVTTFPPPGKEPGQL